MPNQLSMAVNCPGEMVVRMRYVLTTPDWFHLAFFFFFCYLFPISGEFISVFSASYNRKQSKSSALFSSGAPISPHQNANLAVFFFFSKNYFLPFYLQFNLHFW